MQNPPHEERVLRTGCCLSPGNGLKLRFLLMIGNDSLKHKLIVLQPAKKCIPCLQSPGDHFFAQRVFDLPLYHPAQGPRALLRVIAVLGQLIKRGCV